MAISSEDLRKKTFAVVPKGYDRPEVNRFLGELADELQQFNSTANLRDADPEAGEVSTDAGLGATAPATERPAPHDDFDRVGNEISLMLRQAQESAMNIREDAELEARTLVDQVRLDIEADRVAHEQAAGQLISRTEERALSIRTTAEEYASARRAAVDAELEDSESEAAATRQLAAEHLASARSEAEAIVADANDRAREIVAQAELDAEARNEALLSEADLQLHALMDAEDRTRSELAHARQRITTILDQPSMSERRQGELIEIADFSTDDEAAS